MNRLAGKIALITGGGTGIGFATAQRFVSEGAYVYITGRRQLELDIAVDKIGKNVSAIQADVSRLSDLDRLYTTVKRQHDRIDILFANAGVNSVFVPLEHISEDYFDQTFNINVKGIFFTVQKALPLLSDGASVILTASTAAAKGVNAFSVYSATKAAVRSLARCLSTELQARQIRVNAISPGPIESPALKDSLLSTRLPDEQARTILKNTVPLGRIGDPDEVAKAVVFLASDESSFTTGMELFVDGGQAQH